MRFLMMHRLDESLPEAWNPSQEFIEKMGAFIQDSVDKGYLITAEGVLPSQTGSLVRKRRGAGVTVTDGPFTEAKEVIGGFALINAKDRANGCRRYTLTGGLDQARPIQSHPREHAKLWGGG